jgi:hypothetical protein
MLIILARSYVVEGLTLYQISPRIIGLLRWWTELFMKTVRVDRTISEIDVSMVP